MSELKGLYATGMNNLDLGENTLKKIASLPTYFLDEKYSTGLTLANIKEEVFLSSDVTEGDFEKLKDKDVIKILEIPNCKNIDNMKLQEVLGTLDNLEVLIADNTNLESFNFVKKESKLNSISVLNTKITDLSNLQNCDGLKGLRINTSNLDLEPYSDIISKMCEFNYRDQRVLKCGTIVIGGINSTVAILNTLNGTSEKPNNNLSYFNCCQSDLDKNGGLVDFSNTSLKCMGYVWATNISFKVPSCFERVEGSELSCSGIDYSNLTNSKYYNSIQTNATNFKEFLGYETVKSYRNPLYIIGSNTQNLSIGRLDDRSQTSYSYDNNLQEIVEKAPNLTDVTLFGIRGLSDISVLRTLNLTNLEIQYSPLSAICQLDGNLENLGDSLTSLTIKNCSTFTNLDGLKELKNLENLEISNTKLESYVTVTRR